MPLRTLDLGGRKIRQIAIPIASQKIVNIVLAGIHSGHKRRPRHRRNCREGRAQFAEGSPIAQLRQIRQPAFFHKPVGEFRIHPVKSQDHCPLKSSFSIGIAPPQKTKQLPERPRHQRIEGIQERNKDRPERRQHRKSRAWPGVRVGESRHQHHRNQQNSCGAGAPAREKRALAMNRRAHIFATRFLHI